VPCFPELTTTVPLVAMGDATTRTRLVVRPLLVSVEDAAGLLGIGRTTLYELIRQGDVRPIRIGRCVRIPQRELEAFVERLVGESRGDG
jgi:excisionase family DNA binding protein